MKVAVVGAGFSGLAVCYHLLSKGVEVDLYEQKEIGGGASGVASGLLHPYAGEQVRRSWKAQEALEATKELLTVAQRFSKDLVADFSGLLRQATPQQAAVFLEHSSRYKDVEPLSDTLFLIRSGIVVHSTFYLLGLFEASKALGLTFIPQKVSSLEELHGYDAFVLALGNGVFSFKGIESKGLSRVKGQSLLCRWPSHLPLLERAFLAKGHIVPLPKDRLVYVGSTYERNVIDSQAEVPCEEVAKQLLWPRAKELVPELEDLDIVKCKAGIRVSRPGFAVPWIKPVGEKGWMLTAMGSRGLLYHAYFAKMLIDQMLFLS